MNIKLYISDSIQTKLQETSNRYHVSISTIVDILFNEMYVTKFVPNWELDTKYLDADKKHQTTIKINKTNQNELDKVKLQSKSLYLSNLVYAYYNLDSLDGIEKQYKDKLKTNIGNQLARKKEQYWDYNRQYRNVYRARKQYEREQAKKNG